MGHTTFALHSPYIKVNHVSNTSWYLFFCVKMPCVYSEKWDNYLIHEKNTKTDIQFIVLSAPYFLDTTSTVFSQIFVILENNGYNFTDNELDLICNVKVHINNCYSEWVSDCCLMPNSAIFQLYDGENKFIFNKMMMRFAFY